MNVLCFGELLFRQQAVGSSFLGEGENYLVICPGGSEANVAVSLAAMGTSAGYLSAGPDHSLCREILEIMQKRKVDVSRFRKGGDRLGSYILLSANGLTQGEVIYDRKYSSFSHLRPGEIDWHQEFEGYDWFHWTALTPALNPTMPLLMKESLEAAKAAGLTVSVDLNFRSRLWQYGRQPGEVMPELVKYCDVIMGNIWAASTMLGITIDGSLHRNTPREEYTAFSSQSATEIFEKFPVCRHVANTFRFMDSPAHNLFYGTYHTREESVFSEMFETHEVTDRIGSGDAFMAGLIHSVCSGYSPQKIIDTATSAGFRKLFVRGDFGDGAAEKGLNENTP